MMLKSPPPVVRGVDRDPPEPCGHLRLGAKALQLARQRGADVLAQILGLGPRAGQPVAQREEPVVMPLEECPEGRPVAVRRREGEVLVIRVHAHSGDETRAGRQSLAHVRDRTDTRPDLFARPGPIGGTPALSGT